jgi:Tfp pilus assembly protein PilO
MNIKKKLLIKILFIVPILTLLSAIGYKLYQDISPQKKSNKKTVKKSSKKRKLTVKTIAPIKKQYTKRKK